MNEPTMIPLETAITVGTSLGGLLLLAVGVLWRDSAKWRERWSDEVKARARDSDRFLRLLGRRRGENSDPPPTSS